MHTVCRLHVRLVRVEDGRQRGAAEQQVGQSDGDQGAAGRSLDGAERGEQTTTGEDEEVERVAADTHEADGQQTETIPSRS